MVKSVGNRECLLANIIQNTLEFRPENLNRCSRCWSFCDLSEEENVNHFVLQCPMLQADKHAMFDEIRAIPGVCGGTFLNDTCDRLGILIEKLFE